jgi:hypothetical protein
MLWNTNPLSLILKSIDKDANTPPYFRRTSSWTTNPQGECNSIDMTKYICSITFEEEADEDGGADGQLTLQEVIDALYFEYMSTHAMPSSHTVGSAVILVSPKETAC